MRGKARMTAVVLTAALLLAACGRGADEPANGPSVQPAQNAASGKQAAETPQTAAVKYYVSDADMSKLIELTAEVRADAEGGVYRAALEALRKTDEAKGEYSLWTGVEFRSVEAKDGILTVDVSIPEDARLGAPGEALALEAITKTAFQFEEIRGLDILVNGEQTDSLMGHEFLEHPILRESALTP